MEEIAEVAIVILNYNGRNYLEKFLPSVSNYSENYPIIVADNHSVDDSIGFLKTNYPQIQLIQLPQNEGFSQGYNLALRQVQAKYYLLLNSDVEVTENWLLPMVKFMNEHAEAGACQPKIKSYRQKNLFEHAGAGGGFIDKFGYPFCRGRIFQALEEDKGQYNDIREIFWATGACMLIRADLFHQVGGLEADFFAHMEEIDLCWRLKNLGYKIYYVGKSEVYHVGGGTLSQESPFKTYLNFRNNLAMLYKNLPAHRLYKVLIIKLLLDFIAIFFFLSHGYLKNSWSVIRAYLSFYRRIGVWQKRRKQIQRKEAKLSGMLQTSLVFQHFLFKKNEFSQIQEWISK
jgi:GT2 family glycosyltransferase